MQSTGSKLLFHSISEWMVMHSEWFCEWCLKESSNKFYSIVSENIREVSRLQMRLIPSQLWRQEREESIFIMCSMYYAYCQYILIPPNKNIIFYINFIAATSGSDERCEQRVWSIVRKEKTLRFLLITNYSTSNQQIYDVVSSLSPAVDRWKALKRIKMTSQCDTRIYILSQFMWLPEIVHAIKTKLRLVVGSEGEKQVSYARNCGSFSISCKCLWYKERRHCERERERDCFSSATERQFPAFHSTTSRERNRVRQWKANDIFLMIYDENIFL